MTSVSAIGQKFSIANDRENIFYIGIDNPVTIAVESESCNSLIIETDNGSIVGENGSYLFRPSTVGKADIIISKNVRGRRKEIGRSIFRVKRIGNPTFKIGSNGSTVTAKEIAAQQFVRAELDGKYGFDIRFVVESFEVYIIPTDTCCYSITSNFGHKINDELRNKFSKLKANDVLIFKKIIVTGAFGRIEIEPKVITIS